MSSITDENIDFIYEDLKSRGMTLKDLTDELVDHLCCIIEPELSMANNFNVAYNKIISNLEENTFRNLQHKTILSTNLKFQKMKKSMFVFGVSGTILLLLGTIMKGIHLPFASIILCLGFLTILLGFLPLFFITSYKEHVEKRTFFLALVGFLTAFFFISASLFKIQHWPGADLMQTIGKILLVVALLPLYTVNVIKKTSETRANLAYILIILGIGVVTVYMSSSVKISAIAIEKFDSMNSAYLNSSDYFSNKNDSLMLYIENLPENSVSNSIISEIKSHSSELNSLINEIKDKMSLTAGGKNALAEKGNKTACYKVFYKEGYAYKLRTSLEEYKTMLLSLANNESQRQVISTYMDFDLLKNNLSDLSYSKTSLIEGFTMLSEIQKNSNMAEYEILNSVK